MTPSPAKRTKLGIDDLLALKGPAFVLDLIEKATGAETWERAARAAVSHPYTGRDDSIWKSKVNDGIPLEWRLTTFFARIIAEVTESDGLETTTFYQIEAQVNGETRAFTVPAAQFSAMKWLPEHLGKEAVIMPPAEDREVAAAIQLLSPHDTPRRTRYAHTGWITHGGMDVFLDAQGAIGPEGRIDGVEMALPPQLQDYVIEEPESQEALQEAVRASLVIVDVASPEVMVPLLAAVYQAAVEPPADSPYLYGSTGSFKSCLTALPVSHFGRKFNHLYLPGNFASTATANRELEFQAKDVVLPVDDYSPPEDYREAASMEAKADTVFRGAGNRSARSRANRDGSLRAAHPPRCAVISNGTQRPRASDINARMILIRVRKNAVDREKLTAAQQAAAQGLFAQAMFGFIQWLAPDRARRVKWYQARVLELREEFYDDLAHPRTAPAMAGKLAALELMIEYFCTTGAINDAQAEDHLKKFRAALKTLAQAQNPDRAATEPAARFVRLLRDALASGRCHITARSGGAPSLDLAVACGWKEVTQNGNPFWVPAGPGPAIGWIEGPDSEDLLDLYLNPSETLAGCGKTAISD
jgi:hypothetical protein